MALPFDNKSYSTSDVSSVEAASDRLSSGGLDRNLNQPFVVDKNAAQNFQRKWCSLPHRYKAGVAPGRMMPPSLDPCINDPPTPSEFKKKFSLMKHWFNDFTDEQRNLVLSELLANINTSQLHLLSVAVGNRLHDGCPPNCEDPISRLSLDLRNLIFSYLDPASVAKAAQVCRLWCQIASDATLWRKFSFQEKWHLSPSCHKKQVERCQQEDGSINWKQVFVERHRLKRNWLGPHCHIRTFEGHQEGVSCIQFDEHRIVSGSNDNFIKVWNIHTNSKWSVQTLVGHSGMVRCLHLAGNRIVSGSADGTIKVWDIEETSEWSSITCKATMVGHAGTVRCLQVNGEKIVSGSYDHTVRLWQLSTGACILTLHGHSGPVLTVAFSKDLVVSGAADKTIKVWNLETGRCEKTILGHQDAVTTLTFDDKEIISGSLDCTIRLWCISTGSV